MTQTIETARRHKTISFGGLRKYTSFQNILLYSVELVFNVKKEMFSYI